MGDVLKTAFGSEYLIEGRGYQGVTRRYWFEIKRKRARGQSIGVRFDAHGHEYEGPMPADFQELLPDFLARRVRRRLSHVADRTCTRTCDSNAAFIAKHRGELRVIH